MRKSRMRNFNMSAKDSEKDLFSKYSEYVVSYKPFIWDTLRNDLREEYRGKNDLVANFYRYFMVLKEIGLIGGKELSIVDFGIFPGVLPKLIHDLFPQIYRDYCGVGLGFAKEFVEGLAGIGVVLVETELDPSYFIPKKINPVPLRNTDIVLFLDIVEHLANPTYALDEANRCLKKGGHLILTTDNITNTANFLAIIKGKTPLPPLLLTNMFYMGDWRPHYREYAKDDLVWILENSGFKVIRHKYFDRRQGSYSVSEGGIVLDKEKSSGLAGISFLKRIKKMIHAIFVRSLDKIPHFLNHQLIVAVKRYEVDELSGKRPEVQYTTEGWRKIRDKHLGY